MTTLLATVYGVDPVLYAAHKLSASKLILFVDAEANKKQDESVALIKASLGRIITIELITTEVYDVVSIAAKVAEVIDNEQEKVCISITSGRKTKALGLLFGAYARPEKVAKIVYYPEEKDQPPVYLPILKFALSDSQKQVLLQLENEIDSHAELAEKAGISKAMVYRNIKELQQMGLIEGMRLTDAGKMAGV